LYTFAQFISEDLQHLRTALDYLNVDHSISHHNGTTTVSKIVVKKADRNQGLGSKAMKIITAHADQHGHRLALTPSSDFGGSKTRLISFYKNHGFVENKGKHKDFSTRESMYREPK